VLPVLAGEIVVPRQPLPVIDDRFDRLGIVAKCVLEFLSLHQCLRSAVGIHHSVKVFFDLNLFLLAHRIDHVEHLVIPAQLLLCLGINFAHRRP